MSIVIWVIIIHLIEVALIGGYLLIKKNNTLEKVVADQQQYLSLIHI
jgi:hypothetical protein